MTAAGSVCRVVAGTMLSDAEVFESEGVAPRRRRQDEAALRSEGPKQVRGFGGCHVIVACVHGHHHTRIYVRVVLLCLCLRSLKTVGCVLV